MAVPALRIPLGLDTQSFEKSIGQAKSLTSEASNFIVKEFAKSQLKMVVNTAEFRPAVQGATKFLGDQFAKVKPEIQTFTQSAVKETTEAGLKVASVFASPAIKGSFQAFTAVGVPAVTGLAQSLAPLALRAFAAYEAIHLVAEAVGAARNQIAEMVAIADKSANLNVSPQFLQLFEGEARKLKVTTDELDAALSSAFNATKEKAPIDLGKWEAGKERITDIELALRVYNQELAKTAGTQLNGLVLFRDADNQQQKVQAVLTAMVELNKIGQRTAALDIGEKMFGVAFVDRIRQGKTSAEGILETMTKLKASGDGIYPDAIVERAKAVDEQLKLSQERLSRAMKPAWDELASVILNIKGYWAEVVDLIAKGVEYANQLGTGIQRWELQGKRDELKAVNEAMKNGTGLYGAPQLPEGLTNFLGVQSPQDRLKDRAARLQGEIDSGDRALRNTPEGPDFVKPSRGVGAAPTQKSDGQADAFDRATESITKHTAKLEADTQAVGLGEGALQSFRAEAQLLAAAQQAGIPITEKMKDKIQDLAQDAGDAAAALAKARAASETAFSRGSAFLTAEDLQIAQQLRGIYGNDIPAALASSEAAAMRAAAAMHQLSDIGQEVNRGLLVEFGQNIRSGASALESLGKAGVNALGKIADKLMSMAADNLWRSAFGGASGGGLLGLLGLGGSGINANGSISGAVGATSVGGAPLVGAFAGGTNYAPGGMSLVGENGPEIMNVPRGAQIIPNDVLRGGGGGAPMSITYAPVNDFRGASVEAVARLEQAQARDRAEFESKAVAAVRRARTARTL